MNCAKPSARARSQFWMTTLFRIRAVSTPKILGATVSNSSNHEPKGLAISARATIILLPRSLRRDANTLVFRVIESPIFVSVPAPGAFGKMSSASQSIVSKIRPCPMCGAVERKPIAQRDEWEIVECARCSMVFIGSELPYDVQAREHDWMSEYSKEVLRRKEKQPVMLFLSRLLRPLRPDTNGRMLSQTLRWRSEGTLVDFGCGDAGFLVLAKKYFDVTGIELSPSGAQISRQRISAEKILEGPVTEIAECHLQEKSFDVVTQFGYIEHEWNPLAGLRAAYRVLRPGGVTVMKTPNYASWNRRIRGMDWCGYHIPAHCNYFTARTLSRMLRQAGFEPLARPLLDTFPTSDSLWMAARRPNKTL
jgi:2-polyprenyl-3-methyl-5-hydroxy-6-metoxy-1,4-benzoquinol methylase